MEPDIRVEMERIEHDQGSHTEIDIHAGVSERDQELPSEAGKAEVDCPAEVEELR